MLSEEELEKISAGIDKMSPEELKALKENIQKMESKDGELSEEELGYVIAGVPSDFGEETFNKGKTA
jgi:hypothetical protein